MFDKLRIGDSAKSAKTFTPIHPDPTIGKKHGISLQLHGKHSVLYRNAIAAMTRRRKNRDITIDEAVDESVKLIVACCDGWEGVTEEKGKVTEIVKFNRDKLTKVLSDDDFRWMRLQAETFMLQDDNFF